jgi:adenine-specific DNA-methyltransferase
LVFPRGGDGKPRYKLFLKEKKDEGQLANTWLDYLSSNQEATRELKSIFNEKVLFDLPKPLGLLIFCLELATSKDSIILDFFSGSATTAHAVMQLNAEDGGHRKFIMVQLPEPCDEKSEAYKAGYRNICEIGKERIRRAGKKILEEYKNTPFCKGGCQAKPDRGIFDYNAEVETTEREKISPSALQAATPLYERGSLENVSINNNDNSNILNKVSSSTVTPQSLRDSSPQVEPLGQLDIGFRVLRLDSSNMKDVFYRPRDLKKDDLLSYTSNIKEDRTDLDLLFQAMPEIAGADYDAKIEEITISNKKVFKVNNNYIVACFEESINEEVIREIAKLKPYHAIFRDSGFSNDSLSANLEQIFRIESPDTEITVL